MYGKNINGVDTKLYDEEYIFVVIGASKVPRDMYDIADYNIAIGNQPHSEISSLAIFLDRIQAGKQFLVKFGNARKEIIPNSKGKNVINKTIN